MNKQRKIFISGIGTDIGKTVAAAIVTEALHADYWKPVQAGNLGDTDSDFVRRMISNKISVIHPEAFRLTQPMSPHAAAAIDGVKIKLSRMAVPQTNRDLVIEGAGGILVPLNNKRLVIDLIGKFDAELIIVVKNYLGSINHSLMTIEAAKARKLKIAGLIFNGEPNEASQKIILKHSGLPLLGSILPEQQITRETVLHYAGIFQATLLKSK